MILRKKSKPTRTLKLIIIHWVYDNRIKHCNIILEALGKQIPKTPKIERWNPALCPSCGEELSDSLGDGYYQHWYNKQICGCGQKLKWEEED